jgi:hypothetical protein
VAGLVAARVAIISAREKNAGRIGERKKNPKSKLPG